MPSRWPSHHTGGGGSQLSKLRISPSSVSIAGRLVNGECVKSTAKNKHNKRCRRAINLHVSYKLTAAANVTFTLKRQDAGRKVNGRCVKPTKNNRKHKRCTRLTARVRKDHQDRAAGPTASTSTARSAAITSAAAATSSPPHRAVADPSRARSRSRDDGRGVGHTLTRACGPHYDRPMDVRSAAPRGLTAVLIAAVVLWSAATASGAAFKRAVRTRSRGRRSSWSRAWTTRRPG